MKPASAKAVRCAIYTRVSTDQGLEQDFNSIDAQYEASQAYIKSQVHAGWTLIRPKYVASRAATPTALPCSVCWTMSVPARWTSSWSTRSIA
jgi:hypothetical protein